MSGIEQMTGYDELLNHVSLGEFSHLASVASTKCCATGTCDD